MNKKVFIIQDNGQYRKMFVNRGFTLCSSVENADIVCFTGGSDVSPHLYNQRKHPTTANLEHRDRYEKNIFLECVEKNIPMVGICRGGQFLNVMNGGSMYQHVNKHTSDHYIYDLITNEKIRATSTHHQMMIPTENAIIIAVAYEKGFKEFVRVSQTDDITEIVRVLDDETDTEAVFYPHTSSLCFQPHPEFCQDEDLQEYFFSLLDRYTFK